jgi:hypothetical protein
VGGTEAQQSVVDERAAVVGSDAEDASGNDGTCRGTASKTQRRAWFGTATVSVHPVATSTMSKV